MKKLLLIPLILSIVLIFASCGSKEESYEIKEKVFTDFAAEDLDGNIIDESVFAESKVTLINIWGTFCEPCKEELPAFNELCKEYADEDFRIIGIPIDGNRGSAADARAFLAEIGGVDYRNIKVSKSVKPFVDSVTSVPYTVFVNSEGRQIGRAYVGSKSKKEWKKVIDGILGFVNSQS